MSFAHHCENPAFWHIASSTNQFRQSAMHREATLKQEDSLVFARAKRIAQPSIILRWRCANSRVHENDRIWQVRVMRSVELGETVINRDEMIDRRRGFFNHTTRICSIGRVRIGQILINLVSVPNQHAPIVLLEPYTRVEASQVREPP